MAAVAPELLIGAITALALALAPLASRLVAGVGRELSRELDGGRTGENLTQHLDRGYASRSGGEGAMRETEIRQLLEARAFVRRRRGESPPDVDSSGGDVDPDLRAEVRQLVLASNERRRRAGKPPLDVEAEIERRLQDAGR